MNVKMCSFLPRCLSAFRFRSSTPSPALRLHFPATYSCSHSYASSPPQKCFSFNFLACFLAVGLHLLIERLFGGCKGCSLPPHCHLPGYMLTCCRRVISHSDFLSPPPASLTSALHSLVWKSNHWRPLPPLFEHIGHQSS